MKKNIDWHKECLANNKSFIKEEKREVERLASRLETIEQEYNLYSAQIDLAEKEKKDGFDRDKYAIKRLCV